MNNRYIISRLNSRGRRQWLKRALPAQWVDYECFASPFSEAVSDKIIAFQRLLNPNGVFERQKYSASAIPSKLTGASEPP